MRQSADEVLGYHPLTVGQKYICGPPYPLQVYVPEEVIVLKPEIVSPQKVRAWEVRLWAVGDELLDYKSLKDEPDFHGTVHYDQIICVEVWEENGEEGHVAYRHIGYRMLLESEIKVKLNEWNVRVNKYNRPLLPDFAT